MQRAACQFVDPAADRHPKRLDARFAEHMTTGEDVLGDIAYVAEVGGVADKLGGAAELGEEIRDLLLVEAGNLVPLGPIRAYLTQSYAETVQVIVNFLHPVVEEDFRVKLGDVGSSDKNLACARLVALFVRRLDVTTSFGAEFKAAAEPFVVELVESFFDGVEEGGLEQGSVGACG